MYNVFPCFFASSNTKLKKFFISITLLMEYPESIASNRIHLSFVLILLSSSKIFASLSPSSPFLMKFINFEAIFPKLIDMFSPSDEHICVAANVTSLLSKLSPIEIFDSDSLLYENTVIFSVFNLASMLCNIVDFPAPL